MGTMSKERMGRVEEMGVKEILNNGDHNNRILFYYLF